MTPEQALGVLDRVCSQVALSRNDHQAVLDAVNVIAKAIGL